MTLKITWLHEAEKLAREWLHGGENSQAAGRRFMGVDVLTEIEIARPRAEVAAFAGDPANAPRWYVNIKTVEWETAPPLRLGSKVAFVAHFLGRRFAYSYE